MATVLDQLKQMTTIVADTGDFESIAKYRPTDATTNPSLLLAAAQKSQYAHLIDDAIKYGKSTSGSETEQVKAAVDKLLVNFGVEILKLIPGRVSTEVDARYSYDTQYTVNKGLHIIKLYEKAGIDKQRVLIKIASTWEGIRAAEILETKHGIHCNLTLLFGFAQAVACAEANVTLISPFVGRILDWYKKSTGNDYKDASTDPGVQSVQRIYTYYKTHGYKTIVMGASFRSIGEIEQLAGCDFLTIAPTLLEDLYNKKAPESGLPQILAADKHDKSMAKVSYSHPEFLWELCKDPMATEKLAEGIRKFAEDSDKLEDIMREKFRAA